MTTAIATTARVQSIRGVGCKKGYPYYAFGLYEPVARKSDGKLTYRLIESGPEFRSDVSGRNAFPGVPVLKGIRNGTPVERAAGIDAVLTGKAAAVYSPEAGEYEAVAHPAQG